MYAIRSYYAYKDLPIRFAEFGTVYRYEQSKRIRLKNKMKRLRQVFIMHSVFSAQ